MLRYYLGINPEEMSDQQWATTMAQLADIRKKESGNQDGKYPSIYNRLQGKGR